MDENDNKALTIEDIKSMMAGLSDAILEQVDNKFKTLTPKQDEEPSRKPDADKQTLAQRLKSLEDEINRRDQEKAQQEQLARYNSTFESHLGQYDLAYPKETIDLLRNVFSSQVSEVDEKWLSKDGKTLNELVDSFISTPFGQHLLKAPNSQDGSGTRITNAPRSTSQSDNTGLAKLFGLA